MKSIHAYFEELATPSNTMGMGNPGEIGPDTLTEPIGKAFAKQEHNEPEKKKKKKKPIKPLSESLFDDNITSDLSIEKIVKHFRNRDIAKQSYDDIIEQLEILFKSGDRYSRDELKKHPIDTFKNIIIMKSGHMVDDYIFVFSKHRNPEPLGWSYFAWKTWIQKKTKNWSWFVNEYRDFDRRDDWEDKVDIMNHTWYLTDVSYSVLPEKISQDLIKCIMGK